jgi:hypothetical protein
MNRRTTSYLAAAALAAVLLASPRPALAREQSGLGVGANLTLGGISGIALNYWVSPGIMLEFMVATSLNFPRNDGLAIGFNLGLSAGIFGVLAGSDQTNLALGGRIAMLGAFNPSNLPDTSDDQLAIELDVPLRVEHWFDDHFAINAQVGVAIVINADISDAHPTTTAAAGVGTTTGFFGGAGFTYYLDGPVGGATAAPPPVMEERRAAPPPPAPTTTDTGEPDQESGAGW